MEPISGLYSNTNIKHRRAWQHVWHWLNFGWGLSIALSLSPVSTHCRESSHLCLPPWASAWRQSKSVWLTEVVDGFPWPWAEEEEERGGKKAILSFRPWEDWGPMQLTSSWVKRVKKFVKNRAVQSIRWKYCIAKSLLVYESFCYMVIFLMTIPR